MAKDVETESFQEFPVGFQARLEAKLTFLYEGREREGKSQRERSESICIQARIVSLWKLEFCTYALENKCYQERPIQP